MSLNRNITAICAGTKGIGKTWLTVTICHALSLMKKKTLLFDADCSIENAAYQIGFDKTTPYGLLFNGSLTLNNASSYFADGKFDMICSPSGEGLLDTAPIGRAQILAADLSYLAKYYNHVLIDCADYASKNLNPFLKICSNIIVIVNANSASSTEAFKTITELKKFNADTPVYIIVNRASSHEEGRQIFKTLLKASKEYINVNLKLLGVIRQDARIREAVLNQALILNRYPECEGAEDCVALTRRFLEIGNDV